jgi:hypothetical protein
MATAVPAQGVVAQGIVAQGTVAQGIVAQSTVAAVGFEAADSVRVGYRCESVCLGAAQPLLSERR